MAGVEHVFPEIADMLSADDSIRIRSIQEERWVNYPKAVTILRKLERLLEFPRRSRMPCLLIIGRSGMGKTMLLERFCRQNSPAWEPEHDREHTPVLSVVIRPQPNVRRFYGQILAALNAPTTSTAASGVIEDRVYHLLRALGTRMPIVDEVHNVFTATRSSDRDAMMALLRTLTGELKISLVCAGTSEAENALLGDEQLASRYEPLTLQAWQPSTEFQGLVGSALRSMPLRQPSELNLQAIRHMIDIGQGVTARVFRVLADLAEEAILSGTERLNSGAVLDLPLAPRAAAA